MNWPWKPKRVVVLGTELAAARKAEEERIASGVVGPSLVPAGEYEVEDGDYSLITVLPLPLDLKLKSISRQFEDLDPERRWEAAHRLSFDDQYTLIHFAKRAAVLALNHDSVEWCRAGLTALAMVDETRIDVRDFWWAAGLLNHSISKLDENLKEDLEKAIDPSIVGLVHGESKLSEWGYAEVVTGDGIGLVEHGGARYEPAIDLFNIANRISERLATGRYVSRIEIAAKVPDVWFASSRREDASSRLSGALGAVAIHGDLRKEYSVGGMQMFVEWVVEMPTKFDCDQLVADVGPDTELDGRYVIGVGVDRLFALLVAGSWQQGVRPYESLSTLSELANDARVIMATNIHN